MNKLEELINNLCPNGVEYNTLGELGDFIGGLSGKSKKDFENGNCKYISYMNVYENNSINLDCYNDRVQIGDKEKQNSVRYCDVVFTGSSETREECAISAVVTTTPKENIFLNSFCFIWRPNNVDDYNPNYLKHLFADVSIRKQLVKTAEGVTRFNVSKKKMAFVEIPVPPMEVQNEIVRILDSFTELNDNLGKELELRRKQFEYYRDVLLDFSNTDVEYKTVEQVSSKILSGGTPESTNNSYYGGNIPWLRTQEVDFNEITDTGVKITQEGFDNSSAKWVKEKSVIVAMYGATVGRVAYTSIPLTTNQACCNIEPNAELIDYKYLFYILSSMYTFIKSKGQGAQTNINAQIVKKLQIPVPSLEEQKRIVSILDSFDKLCNDTQEGLPSEIELRKKQYEYYREKLLTFKRVN